MRITELEINIMAVPQGYYLATAISKDKNFDVGIPALFNKQYNITERIANSEHSVDFEIGEAYLLDNVYLLVVKDSSYDMPDRDALINAIHEMRVNITENKLIKKLAIPKICCGKNGFDWQDIKLLIEEEFKDTDVDILVCIQ